MKTIGSKFQPKLQVLDRTQLEHIHMATLEVLERTGVRIPHQKALEVLDGGGARVDGERVRIPAWLVEDAIRQAPSRIVLGKRDGMRSVFLERDRSWFGPSLDCIDYLDPATEERRPFTSDDCGITARIADALPNFTWVTTIGMAANTETLALDLIDRMGPGGHYLNEEHTRRHFREVWYSDLFDRTIHDVWQAEGAKRFEERLRDKTLSVMEHKPVPLAPEIIKEIDRMAKHWQ